VYSSYPVTLFIASLGSIVEFSFRDRNTLRIRLDMCASVVVWMLLTNRRLNCSYRLDVFEHCNVRRHCGGERAPGSLVTCSCSCVVWICNDQKTFGFALVRYYSECTSATAYRGHCMASFANHIDYIDKVGAGLFQLVKEECSTRDGIADRFTFNLTYCATTLSGTLIPANLGNKQCSYW
jgi:hypothetical protein